VDRDHRDLCPIFIPLLAHFNVDPILFGTMVAVNLQAAFLSPPVAMSAFYLKASRRIHVTLNQNLRGHDAVHGHRVYLPHVSCTSGPA